MKELKVGERVTITMIDLDANTYKNDNISK